MMYTLLLILTFFTSSPSAYCSCADPGTINEEKYQSYDLVLKGEIVKIRLEDQDKILVVRVNTLYKGGNPSELLEIRTPAEPGYCGLNAGTGDEWLFFAYSKEDTFSTNLCTRSKNLDPDNYMYGFQKEDIKEDLSFLEARLQLDENE